MNTSEVLALSLYGMSVLVTIILALKVGWYKSDIPFMVFSILCPFFNLFVSFVLSLEASKIEGWMLYKGEGGGSE